MEFWLFFLHKFRDIDVSNQEQRQRLIDIFVNAIYLYDDDRIDFVSNYKEGTKTVSLKDIRGSDLDRLGAPSNPLKMLLQSHLRGFVFLWYLF